MKLAYRLAEPGDDPALRKLLATVPMPGAITVTFEREPSYFAAMRMSGEEWQVFIAENAATGELAGVLCRSVQERFVNGALARIAYWGQLRIREEYRGAVFLPGAFSFAREVCGNDPVDGSFAVIAQENPVAKRVFTERHARLLPRFVPVARLLTFGIALGRRWIRKGGEDPAARGGTLHIAGGSASGLSSIVSFLRAEGEGRQLYPVYDERYFRECGIDPACFIVAARSGRIVGAAGLWDQSGCKQTVVRNYSTALRLSRPLYNLTARTTGRSPLPNVGEHLHSIYLSFIAVEGQDPGIFSAILAEACSRAAALGFSHLMLGLSEADPLTAALRVCPHITYTGVLYTLEFAPGTSLNSRLDGRTPYVEIATL